MADNQSIIEGTLTPRQIECVKVAASSGYYDHPKQIKLRELSELMDIPRSTLQEHLNRAELAMMKWASEQINSQ
jgi:predicted DNA binding protein